MINSCKKYLLITLLFALSTSVLFANITITGRTYNISCKGGSIVIGDAGCCGSHGAWSYSWSPAVGLSSTVDCCPTLSTSPFNPTTVYTETITDHGTGLTDTAVFVINFVPEVTMSISNPNVSRCGPGTVQLSATPSPSGYTVQWYTDPNDPNSGIGTGTTITSPSINTTTTFYVLAFNAPSGCYSNWYTVVATINEIPTITGTTPVSRCGTGTAVLGATASAGTINWYAASTGGTSLGTGTSFTTPSISSTTTYYVDATANGCTTASRTAVIATINSVATISGTTPDSRCATGTVILGATASAGTINWYAASTGGTSLGTGTSFTTPSISSTTTYYVDATANGCTTGSRTSVVATINAIPTISGTTPASRCGTGTVVLGATASAGTINWYAASTGGTSLGTGTSFTTPSISATTTYYVDATANGCTTGSRTAVVATINVIPTITGTTPGSNCGTGTVVLGAATSAGTINWYAASTGGTSLGTGTSFTTPSISSTTTYYVDATASGCTTASRTAVVATINSVATISGTTPGSRCGTGTVVLGATASTGTINWYAASTGGTSLGTGTSFTTPSISATTTYYVDATASGCTTSSRTAVVATINAIPTISGTTPASRCGTGTVVLGATASAGTINWYAASTGGTSLGTGTSFTTPSLSSTTTYYVDATANGCTTGSRTAVVATINTIPTITGTTPASRCGTGIVILGATASAGTINWYAASTGGTSLGTGTSFTTPSISSTTTYYVDAIANGCTTGSRTAIVATVSSSLVPAVAIAITSGSNPTCPGSSVVFTATPTNGGSTPGYQWKVNGVNAGTNSATYSSTTLENGNVISCVMTSNASCASPLTAASTPVTMTVNLIPTITTTQPAAAICSGGNVYLSAGGASTYIWSPATGLNKTTGETVIASPASNTVYTVTGSIGGCSNTAQVTVNVNTGGGGDCNFHTLFLLDGAYLNITDGTSASPMYFVVDDPSPAGIIRFPTGGNINTKGQYNFVKWNAGATVGNYVFPFGAGPADSSYIPFSFNKISGNASISASTWNTNPQNMPHAGLSGVTAITDMTGVGDSLTGAIDRFWDVRTSAPVTADVTYSYKGLENTLVNPTGLLQMQRWTGNTASPWTVPQGLGNKGVTSGIGIVGPVMGQITFSPFVLVGISDFLGKGGGSICTSVYPSNDRNYVITETLQKAESSETNVNALVVNDKMTSIQYLDGLGRPLETIAVNAAPNYNHLVTFNRYDNFGREAKTYLPYSASNDCAGFILDPLTDQAAFYNNAPDIEHSPYPYAETVFEPSPLNRVTTQGAAGTDWQISSGHTTKLEYSSNIANEVKNFVIGNVLQYYAAGTLNKKLVRDENWAQPTGGETNDDYLYNHTTEEFTDKEGHIVLKRTYNNAVAHNTYYLYDIYGNLTTVIPPLAEASFIPNNINTQTQLDNLCYQYRYDEFNRQVEKKIPGKGWEYTVYDKLDRPVLTQDANERALNQWSYVKYDAFGRPAYTGIYTVTVDSTRQILQNTLKILLTPLYETKNTIAGTVGGSTVYYSNNAYPTANLQLLTINYYDDYVFDAGGLSVPATVYGVNTSANLKGLATGTKVLVLGTTNWITSLMGYDKKDRSVYTAELNSYLNFTETTEIKLDFTGKVLETKITHNKVAQPVITVTDKMSYDHVGRLLSQKKQINTEVEELIAANSYNQVGELIRKDVGNASSSTTRLQNVNYAYNIRGWLKQINNTAVMGNDLFAFALNYNTTQLAGGTKLYNGNISEAQWKTTSDNQLRSYGYHYDDLDRINSASFITAAADNGRYNSSNITYDKNGNILSLNRNGWQNSASVFNNMDVLSYTYNGNQLLAVNDAGSTGYGFVDGNNSVATGLDDYAYDANGNLTLDRNKTITAISYNRLNLPQSITVNGTAPNNGIINYVYDATGAKQSKTSTPSGGQTTVVQYAGNFEYQSNGSGLYDLQFISQPEGYVTPYTDGTETHYRYVYQYKDQLGDVRLSYTKDATAPGGLGIIEESNYYEFGMKHQGYNTTVSSLGNSRAQMFKYNHKELQDEFGLNLYDYGARFYDVATGRWSTLDDLGELNYNESPFCYVGNNPITRIDPDGRTWWDKVVGTGVAVLDNFAPGLNFRGSYTPIDAADYNHGQDLGDAASVLMGTDEAAGGTGMVEGAVVVTAGTGGLALEVTAPAALIGGAATAHGLMMAGRGAANLKDQKGRVQEKAKPVEKTEPAGRTASGHPTDAKGNKLGPSGKPQVNVVKHSSEKAAKDAARNEGKKAPVKHTNPKKGEDHYHSTDQKGRKNDNSTHHEY